MPDDLVVQIKEEMPEIEELMATANLDEDICDDDVIFVDIEKTIQYISGENLFPLCLNNLWIFRGL